MAVDFDRSVQARRQAQQRRLSVSEAELGHQQLDWEIVAVLRRDTTVSKEEECGRCSLESRLGWTGCVCTGCGMGGEGEGLTKGSADVTNRIR